MSSLWIQTEGNTSRKLVGNLSRGKAQHAMEEFLAQWPANGTFKRVDGMETLLLVKGKPWATLYVEHFSVPSADEPGQPKRKATA